MLVDGLPPPLASPDGNERAQTLINAGLPFDSDPRSARDFAKQCELVLGAFPRIEPLAKIKIMTAYVVALSHFDPQRTIDSAKNVAAIAELETTDLARTYALTAWNFAHAKPEHSEQRAANAYEILAIADAHSEPELYAANYVILMVALLEQGNIRSLDIEQLKQREARSTLRTSGDSHIIDWFHCLRLILDGDMDAAEAQAEATYASGLAEGTEDLALYTTQKCMILWMRGDLVNAENYFLAARRAYPEQLLWTASLAWLWLAQGRRSAALSMLRSIPDIDEIPEDPYWLSTMTLMTEVARLLDDSVLAERLLQRLTPHAGRLVPAGIGVTFWGTCARSLGLLAEYLGRIDEAQEYF